MKSRFLLTIGLAAGLAACGETDPDNNNLAAANAAQPEAKAESRTTVGDSLANSGDHRAFVQALDTAGLTEALRGAGPYTVFVPANEAMASLVGADGGESAPAERRERLRALLSAHIVPGAVTAADLRRAIDQAQGRAELATMSGETLSLSREGDTILIGEGERRARLTQADQIHSNGVVHSIDSVLAPAAPEG